MPSLLAFTAGCVYEENRYILQVTYFNQILKLLIDNTFH